MRRRVSALYRALALAVPYFAAVAFAAAVSSCSEKLPPAFPVVDASGAGIGAHALGKAAAAGKIGSLRDGELRYVFPEVPGSVEAFEIEYAVDEEFDRDGASIVLRIGSASWLLPPDDAFIAGSGASLPASVRYRVPLDSAPEGFSVAVEASPAVKAAASGAPIGGRRDPKARDEKPLFSILSVAFAPAAFGYGREGSRAFVTPYVHAEGNGSGRDLAVSPPAGFSFGGRPDGSRYAARIGVPPGRSVVVAGAKAFSCDGGAAGRTYHFAPALLEDGMPSIRVELQDSALAASARIMLEGAIDRPFPEIPLAADPGLVLAYPREAWRDPRYEVFAWESFPSVLIYDTADYAVQDRLFKRLAFFVEKAGFRGRLSSDAEIGGLHGWNAHDYRSEDLAAFFETARATAFRLNSEERELFATLVSSGVLRGSLDGQEPVEAGRGAVISISRESEGYLRHLFMTHEAFHGIFFIDEEFRLFCAARWEALGAAPRRFLKAYFDSRRYDVNDEYLMANELMAYCLQQPVAGAAKYFGKTLPERLAADAARKSALPDRDDASGTWPALAAAFEAEAAAFDAYARLRWGLRAGSVSGAYQMSRTNAAR